MGEIIAITNQKGGVGKTTSSVNISACLAEENKRVLLVDLDPQGNSTSGIGLKAGDKTIYEALMHDMDIKDCVTDTCIEKFKILPADIRLSGAEAELVDMENREYFLKTVIESLKNEFDYIIIDCPPSLGLLTINALSAADSVIIPIQCEYYALEGVTSLIKTITRVTHTLNTKLKIKGILMTMMDIRTNLSIQVVDTVREHFKDKVFKVTIPRNIKLSEAPSHGIPINLYDKKSNGAEAYRLLVQEIINA